MSLLTLEQEDAERMGTGFGLSPILLFPKEQQENNGLYLPDKMLAENDQLLSLFKLAIWYWD